MNMELLVDVLRHGRDRHEWRVALHCLMRGGILVTVESDADDEEMATVVVDVAVSFLRACGTRGDECNGFAQAEDSSAFGWQAPTSPIPTSTRSRSRSSTPQCRPRGTFAISMMASPAVTMAQSSQTLPQVDGTMLGATDGADASLAQKPLGAQDTFGAHAVASAFNGIRCNGS